MLQRTNTNKATGIDKLLGIFIKGGAELLAAPLTQIINYQLPPQLSQIPVKLLN